MTQFDFYNRTYSMEENNIRSFRLLGDEEKKLKDSVFRYSGLSTYSIDSLVNHTFYATQPDMFNDLYDFYFKSIDFSKMDEAYIKTMMIPDATKSLYIQGLKEDPNEFFKIFYTLTIAKVGVLCVTIDDLNEQMWAYYGNNQGFQVELDFTKFSNRYSLPIPINYVEDIKQIDITKVGGPFSILIQITAKKNTWKHENEYRILVKPDKGKDFKVTGCHKTPDTLPYIERLVEYPKEAIKSITLGYHFFNSCPISSNEYRVKIDSADHELRIKLLDECLQQNIPLKKIIIAPDSFRHIKCSLNVKKVSKDTFNIQEITK